MEAGQFLDAIYRNMRIAVLVTFIFSCAGCVSFARIDGPYEGRVVDADTKAPIEGVVVHGNWYKVWGIQAPTFFPRALPLPLTVIR